MSISVGAVGTASTVVTPENTAATVGSGSLPVFATPYMIALMENAACNANADALEEYIPEHKEAIMAQADHAVEAMPKKVNPYENELDKIELPEYMQAKKTVREETAEIPSLPEIE